MYTQYLYRNIFLYCTLFTTISIIMLDLSLDVFERSKPSMLSPIAGTSQIVRLFSARDTSSISVKDIFIDAIKMKSNLTKKYILLWTSPLTCPFVYLGTGNQAFVERRCQYTNCHVVTRRDYENTSRYDVIAFVSSELDTLLPRELPQKRSQHQKYVFASIESGTNYPVCSSRWDGYFNWTWAFKLDSDSRWGFITVRDSKNRVVGPGKEMHWIRHEDMEPVSDSFKRSLRTKKKAAAWFVSNCNTESYREYYVEDLKRALEKYSLTVDVYGKCGILSCDSSAQKICDKLIEDDYYFYLAFENSFYEDYVTEKVLHGLRNKAIPIVYGGANYSRFMPDGIYLDATQMNATVLAEKMNGLIHNIDEYAEFFRWRKHYSYHPNNEDPETDDYCGFCALLNNEEKVANTTVYDDLRRWWDPPDSSVWCRE